MTFIPFPICHWSIVSATRTFVTNNAASAGSTTYTFTSVALGTAIGTSLVAVVVHIGANGGSLSSISSATINGVSATIHAQNHGGGSGGAALSIGVCGVISATTSGTSGSIVITGNTSSVGCGIEVYRLNNLTSATPNFTATASTGANGGSSESTTMNITATGILLLGATNYGGGTITGSGATKDVTQVSNGQVQCWGGSNDGLPTQSNRSLSASWSSTAGGALAAATWN